MIKSVILIKDCPLDVVVLDWQNMPRKRLYDSVGYYNSLGYCVLVEKILHRRDHSSYRKVVYGANEKYLLSLWEGGSVYGESKKDAS